MSRKETSPLGDTALGRYPITLLPLARRDRIPLAAICVAFDVTHQDVLTHTVLLRDLLVSRARERGLVPSDWVAKGDSVGAFLREISTAISATWMSLLAPKELVEFRHVTRLITHLRRSHRKEDHVQDDHCA